MSKQTSNKFSPEVRSRAVRLVLDHEHEHPSHWTTDVLAGLAMGALVERCVRPRSEPRDSRTYPSPGFTVSSELGLFPQNPTQPVEPEPRFNV